MSYKPLLTVSDISKKFNLLSSKKQKLKFFINQLFNFKNNYKDSFKALDNISFKLFKGETLGILGQNGSGKSTLLQIIAGTMTPTSGKIICSKKITALLELGSGFNPEFSGEENVYINGALLGLKKKDLNKNIDEIFDFAGLDFFRHQPVKTYSSGMVMRLAFSVYAQTKPEILIIDEALAVGDIKFQTKCFNRINELKKSGTSIILVSHSVEQIIAHCDRALIIDQGKIINQGLPKDMGNIYYDLIFGTDKNSKKTNISSINTEDDKKNVSLLRFNSTSHEDIFSHRNGYNLFEYRWGDGGAKIIDYEILINRSKSKLINIKFKQKISLSMKVLFNQKIFNPIYGLTIKNKDGFIVFSINNDKLNETRSSSNYFSRGNLQIIEFDFINYLVTGDYFISLGVASRINNLIQPHDRRYDSIHLNVISDNNISGVTNLECKLKVKN